MLSYANQRFHAEINRHLVRDLLRHLAASEVRTTPPPSEEGAPPQRTAVTGAPSWGGGGGRAGEFVDWLREHGHRVPNGSPSDTPTDAPDAKPDLVYHLDHGSVAVFVDDDGTEGPGRDAAAEDTLLDAGWTVVRVRQTDTFENMSARYPSVFGPRQKGPR